MKNVYLYPLAVFTLFSFLFLPQACKKANQDPTSHFTITPETGSTNTTFQFDASACTDDEDPGHMLEVRWDFEGDGTWDTDWSTEKTTDQKYAAFSQHSPTLEVRDSDGSSHTKTIPLLVVNGDTSSFKDPRDGKVYKIVTIGTQTWFAENLNYDTAGSSYYNNDSTLGAVYGRLYDGETAKTICPDGWHLPGRDEWKTLEDFLKPYHAEKLKEAGFTHWGSELHAGTNESGFTALPAGLWVIPAGGGTPYFTLLREQTNFWSNTSSGPYISYCYIITTVADEWGGAFEYLEMNASLISIRCVKD